MYEEVTVEEAHGVGMGEEVGLTVPRADTETADEGVKSPDCVALPQDVVVALNRGVEDTEPQLVDDGEDAAEGENATENEKVTDGVYDKLTVALAPVEVGEGNVDREKNKEGLELGVENPESEFTGDCVVMVVPVDVTDEDREVDTEAPTVPEFRTVTLGVWERLEVVLGDPAQKVGVEHTHGEGLEVREGVPELEMEAG